MSFHLEIVLYAYYPLCYSFSAILILFTSLNTPIPAGMSRKDPWRLSRTLILEQPVMGFHVDSVHSIDDFFDIITGKSINISKPKVSLIHNGSISFQVFFYPFEFFFCPVTSEFTCFYPLDFFLLFLGCSLPQF